MKIGITGGIGSGKSTVSRYLESKGYTVLDCDKIAREVVGPGMPALTKIASELGNFVLDENGALDREKTGKLVFADDDKRRRLNEITHSAIHDIIIERSQSIGDDVIFIDAALMFESGLDKEMDEVWSVICDLEERRRRIAERDGMDDEMIDSRLAAQMSDDERKEKSSEILDNSGSLDELYAQIERLLKKYV